VFFSLHISQIHRPTTTAANLPLAHNAAAKSGVIAGCISHPIQASSRPVSTRPKSAGRTASVLPPAPLPTARNIPKQFQDLQGSFYPMPFQLVLFIVAAKHADNRVQHPDYAETHNQTNPQQTIPNLLKLCFGVHGKFRHGITTLTSSNLTHLHNLLRLPRKSATNASMKTRATNDRTKAAAHVSFLYLWIVILFSIVDYQRQGVISQYV
jgi:hypothetical protein